MTKEVDGYIKSNRLEYKEVYESHRKKMGCTCDDEKDFNFKTYWAENGYLLKKEEMDNSSYYVVAGKNKVPHQRHLYCRCQVDYIEDAKKARRILRQRSRGVKEDTIEHLIPQQPEPRFVLACGCTVDEGNFQTEEDWNDEGFTIIRGEKPLQIEKMDQVSGEIQRNNIYCKHQVAETTLDAAENIQLLTEKVKDVQPIIVVMDYKAKSKITLCYVWKYLSGLFEFSSKRSRD